MISHFAMHKTVVVKKFFREIVEWKPLTSSNGDFRLSIRFTDIKSGKFMITFQFGPVNNRNFFNVFYSHLNFALDDSLDGLFFNRFI